MLGRTTSAIFAASTLTLAGPAFAQTRAIAIDVRAAPLSYALQDLARQTGAELLFDREMVGPLQAPAVRGRLTVEAALQRLTSGTSLAVRRAASGAWVVERQSAPPLAQPDVAVAELLVIGARTQNVDIRRMETDVQPYQVITGDELTRAHRDNLDQYFRNRVPANAHIASVGLDSSGESRSRIDLRGLGEDSTLVLIDGRRMPSMPGDSPAFEQPDLNAIPMNAIDRVETLTGTSGGIYGFGALGGVANVVLKRDYRGAELNATAGLSSRGDARRLALQGRLGFSPNDGRTELMVSFGGARSRPLRVGDRNYATRDRELTVAFAPQLVRDSIPVSDVAFGDSVGVFNAFGDEPLVFKPEYGGKTLTANYTFLPSAFQGSTSGLVASLSERAGRFDPSLTAEEASSYLQSDPSTDALIVSARHRFGRRLEVYVDAVVLRNRGRSVQFGGRDFAILSETSEVNPFEQTVWLTFPTQTATDTVRSRLASERYTAGVVTELLFDWRATAQATLGSTTRNASSSQEGLLDPLFLAFNEFGPGLDPLSDLQGFRKAISEQTYDSQTETARRNRLRELSLRLAGPVFTTAGGQATMTVLLERRREEIEEFLSVSTTQHPLVAPVIVIDVPGPSSVTQSIYAELKAPIFGSDAPAAVLRGLEVQLAVRRDDLKLDYTSGSAQPQLFPIDVSFLPVERAQTSVSETAYTVGAKVLPAPWLMLRGSYATGGTAPPIYQLQEQQDPFGLSLAADPKRGDTPLWYGGLLLLRSGGSPDLRSIQASTLSLGVVLNPLGDTGPRLALDYSLIRRRGDLFRPDEELVLAREDLWPERVTRGPLTDEDRAAGYTGGPITELDLRAMNADRRTLKTLDAQVDWPMRLAGGQLRLYATATYRLKDVTSGPFEADLAPTGYLYGPLRWRANGGADWSSGRSTIGANVQVFDRYRIYPPSYPEASSAPLIEAQGSRWVRSQIFLDLYASRSFRVRREGSAFDMKVEAAVINALDKSPRRETAFSVFSGGYSPYGDPRGRRFEVTLSASF